MAQRPAAEPSTHVLRRVSTLALASVELRVTAGPDEGRTFEIADASARVGTGTGGANALVLTDPSVSRIHCEVSAAPGGIHVVDLDSTNGTFAGGVRIKDAVVPPGATLTLGATNLLVSLGEESVHLRLSDASQFGRVLGSSVAMRRLFAVLERAAPSDNTILIEGETGTGKEIVARSIHEASPRRDGPFVVVDCGAIAENLIESELFGHVKGAFTGASGDRRGLFAEANGGTLFLDEIGELPLSVQPKLLRALESREVRRVGDNRAQPIDVRVVAATHRPLSRRVNEGTFREDLYYRLAVIELHIPPLRERREDIPLLVRHFHERATGVGEAFPPDLVTSLVGREWPGNARELRNYVERIACLGVEMLGERRPAPAEASPAVVESLVSMHLPFKEARDEWLDRFDAAYLTNLLRRTNGNVTRAAALGGLNRRTLQRLMATLNLRGTDEDE